MIYFLFFHTYFFFLQNRKFLFCKLTKKKLIKRLSVLEKHVNGKTFKKLVKGFEEKQKNQGKEHEEILENPEKEENEIEDA